MPGGPSLLELPPDVLADARRMPAQVSVPPVTRPFDVTIEVPGSKSITNRALLLAALAGDACEIYKPLLDAEDAQVMLAAIQQLGARVDLNPGGDVTVWGTGSRWKPSQRDTTLNLANAGTATRFLAASALLAPPGHTVTIDGSSRMRERPIGELVAMLRQLGGAVDELGPPGFPPIRVHGLEDDARLSPITVGPTASSQFISAVLMLGPFVQSGVAVFFDGAITSEPYVQMTIDVLERAGASAFWYTDKTGAPSAQCNTPEAELGGFQMTIEPDASSAGYWWTAAVLCPGSRATIPGRWTTSIQGDARLANLIQTMSGGRAAGYAPASPGALTLAGAPAVAPVDADLSAMPDAAMALAAACALATGPSVLRGLKTLRVKETDRVEALRAELTRLGCRVRIDESNNDIALHITPLNLARDTGDAVVQTYNDHRMAMGMALIGLRRRGVIINNPACVAKTYASFWRDLRTLYG